MHRAFHRGGLATALFIASLHLTACDERPCTNRNPVVEGGEWEVVGSWVRATVVSSHDASAIGNPISDPQQPDAEFYFSFWTDNEAGIRAGTQVFGYAPIVPQCGHFRSQVKLPLDGQEFVMNCIQTWPAGILDAELRLRYIADDPVVPIDGIGPEGRFVGEYRNGTEVYAVEIYGLYGEYDACVDDD